MKRTFIILVAIIVACTHLMAQEKVKVALDADFISHYVWRGQDMADVCVQPTLNISWRGLSLTAEGSVGLSNSDDAKEIDLTAQYTIGGLSFGIADYWADDADQRYFYYNSHETGHVFEGFVAYDFGILSASWQTNFAGFDGYNKSGRRAYSSYAEVNVPFRLASLEWEATAGVVPYATDYYGTNGFAVTNVSLKASKTIPVSKYLSLPLFAQIVANPCSGRAYFVFGITISPNL